MLIVKTEAEKGVAQAAADKQKVVLVAEGERDAARLAAEAKALEGQGIAKYNAAIAPTLQQQIKLKELEIEITKAQKWDGRQIAEQQVVVPGFGNIQYTGKQ